VGQIGNFSHEEKFRAALDTGRIAEYAESYRPGGRRDGPRPVDKRRKGWYDFGLPWLKLIQE